MPRLIVWSALCALLSAHAPAASTPAEPDMRRPLDWLVAAQNDDGSWGDGAKDPRPDVATTAFAGIALLRLGHTGSLGQYQEHTRRAATYVAAAVERTPQDEIAINPAGTLPQRKLGRNIDTFVAAQFLAEVLPTLRGPLQARAERALGSVVKRIERAQAKDGSYSHDGWAPLLASAFASNGLYAAQRAGANVDKDVLAKGQAGLVGKYDDKTKTFGATDAAGVQLYSVAASMMAAEQVARSGAPANPELKRRAEEARKAASSQLANENVMRGFGSYGGEEHVSYMLTAEAKAALGGDEWAGFRKSMRARLAAIQRENGTWRGDHCITSTTFCTAASLITLAIESHAGRRAS
jgi:ethanolamine utilization microcompartment shell protein EutL